MCLTTSHGASLLYVRAYLINLICRFIVYIMKICDISSLTLFCCGQICAEQYAVRSSSSRWAQFATLHVRTPALPRAASQKRGKTDSSRAREKSFVTFNFFLLCKTGYGILCQWMRRFNLGWNVGIFVFWVSFKNKRVLLN